MPAAANSLIQSSNPHIPFNSQHPSTTTKDNDTNNDCADSQSRQHARQDQLAQWRIRPEPNQPSWFLCYHTSPPNKLLLFQVAEKCHDLNLDNDKLKRVMDRLEQSFVEGLQTETAAGAAVKMLPTYVRATSVGREKGKYLALDLGGSRFRWDFECKWLYLQCFFSVLIIELNGKDTTIKQRTFEFPESCKTGTGAALFDHVAACLAQFMDEQQMEPQTKMPLGFTFSFPCKQEGLTSATLMGWTKGFSVSSKSWVGGNIFWFQASGVVGENVVRLLREACQRKGVNIDVCALINDTVGTMLACSFFEPNCSIGLIVGTGRFE